jgi:small subunit ribosomal protein S17
MTEEEQNEQEQAPEEAAADAPAEEPAAEADAPAAEPEAAAGSAEPEEELSPKERRKRERATRETEPRAQRSPEERAAERAERRARRATQRRSYRARVRQKRAGRETAAPAPTPREHGPGSPKIRQGVVVSAKPDKTITVRIDVTRSHRMYKKIVRESSTLQAHDERNEANEGDTVRVIESRPLSRTKRWRLVDILERAR